MPSTDEKHRNQEVQGRSDSPDQTISSLKNHELFTIVFPVHTTMPGTQWVFNNIFNELTNNHMNRLSWLSLY